MRQIVRAFVLVLVLVPSSLQAQQTLAGDWDVIVTATSQTIPLVLHISQGEDGYTGTFDAPSQAGADKPISRIVSEHPEFVLEFETGGPPVVFEGIHEGDQMSGTFTQATAEGTFEGVRRSGKSTEAPSSESDG